MPSSIRIGPIAGSASASTGAGSVVIDVADAGGEAQTIDVTTGNGSVEIRSEWDLALPLLSRWNNPLAREAGHRVKTGAPRAPLRSLAGCERYGNCDW